MTNRSCDENRDLLVDYADGELSSPDSQVVAEHLARCAECQEVVKNLERSLDLAKAIWLDNLEAGASDTAASKRVIHRLRWLAVAAAVLVAVGGTLFLCTLHKSPTTVTYAQIEQQVTRAAAAARLMAAIQVLAKCEDTESIIEQQARYILSHYGDTAAAWELKTTMPSILKGATYD